MISAAKLTMDRTLRGRAVGTSFRSRLSGNGQVYWRGYGVGGDVSLTWLTMSGVGDRGFSYMAARTSVALVVSLMCIQYVNGQFDGKVGSFAKRTRKWASTGSLLDYHSWARCSRYAMIPSSEITAFRLASSRAPGQTHPLVCGDGEVSTSL